MSTEHQPHPGPLTPIGDMLASTGRRSRTEEIVRELLAKYPELNTAQMIRVGPYYTVEFDVPCALRQVGSNGTLRNCGKGRWSVGGVRLPTCPLL